MARLDQLIDALVKHSAQSLVLTEGTKPSLIIDGQSRPIVKTALDISQLRQLAAEVTPSHLRDDVMAGNELTFVYGGASIPMNVEIKATEVILRPFDSAAPEPPAPALAQAQAPAPSVAVAAEPPAPTPIEAPPVSVAEPPAPAPRAVQVAPSAGGADASLNMDRLFHLMVEQGASDLHMSAECKPMLRIDGMLMEMDDVPILDPDSLERILFKITPEAKKDQFAERFDTDFGYSIEGLARFRCNLFRDRKGVGGVFRVIPTEILSAEQLGLSKAIQDFATLTKGLVLVTGPTGSGKSTTQAAMLDLVNTSRSDHVITIEDPIEFVHENKKCLVNQREVPVHTKSFKSALRAALREDPDVVLVGELRDLETVAIAMETAETGHLVFGTLHTNSAVSTIDRVIDQFPADEQSRIRIMLSESLKGIIAQVLCQKIGGGRVAAHEVLVVNAAVSNLIREGKTFQIPSIMQTGRGLGMITMSDCLLQLVEKKLIEPKEAYLKAVDKASLLGSFRSKGISADFLNEEKASKTKTLEPV